MFGENYTSLIFGFIIVILVTIGLMFLKINPEQKVEQATAEEKLPFTTTKFTDGGNTCYVVGFPGDYRGISCVKN